MISFYTLYTLSFCHWLFDFKCQTRNMANNKSKSNRALLHHVAVYTMGLVTMAMLNLPSFNTVAAYVAWVLTNSVMHAVTDYFTSRLSSAFYKNDDEHNFFATIGIDQFIHAITLFGTFIYFTQP